MSKIAIYSGTFDPIHVGHITFALQVLESSEIKEVYFLPERNPRDKENYEHFGHRVAMIKRASRPHKRLKLLELEDKQFSVSKTLPKLQAKFKGAELVFLFGSDKVKDLLNWPNIKALLKSSDIIIAVRQDEDIHEVKAITDKWPAKSVYIIPSFSPDVSSAKLRSSLLTGKPSRGLLTSVSKYIKKNWLYISLAHRL